ncbi:Smr/MutS family protein [Paracoccus sp. 1_MG-2023]|uniref:Smr/MutS family protein n=1 Tax=unclassified Paracoccus (in: a-proteobacteria) TaxID=2688777 RepID=UPI001C08D0B1|nr:MULTISPECIES: Smr/MutS family protein [unclassified Paracoccus (in: a-proteobacteria)]MBU2957196.1 Smr/MutS family protein [Paracoccus sp. C2R09]MDO6669083.1 Smr/MutS family protein [Paracoccus sp. 1_MG-2023]
MRRRKGLSEEDRALWSKVAESAHPMHPRRKADAIPEGMSAPLPRPDLRDTSGPAPVPAFRVGQAAQPQKPLVQRNQSPAERLAQSGLRMDAKTHKRMTRGKLKPEARLDLHGMTLAAAHPELIQFILSCHAGGLRLVLVITGKGRGDHGPLPTRPGALRHQVPHWLHTGPLGMVVQQVTAAHYRHGGEGAYYVYLRR